MKKLNNFKWFSFGIAACLLVSLVLVPAVAANMKKTATLEYSNIKITLDGKAITPTDANGNTVEPFTIDGTTYLPVRGIANALGMGVDWEAATQTVKLTSSADVLNSSQADSGTVLAEKNNIKITYTGIDSSGSSKVEVKLLIENNTSKTYVVQSRDCSVNGYMVSPTFSPTVAPGKKINSSLTFYKSDLAKNDITTIETVELYFLVFEHDDWSNDFKTNTVTINCK